MTDAMTRAEPPTWLYVGARADQLDDLRQRGLRAEPGVDVRLTMDRRVATGVAAPVLITVLAATMVAAGHAFRRTDDGTWLIGHVPPPISQ